MSRIEVFPLLHYLSVLRMFKTGIIRFHISLILFLLAAMGIHQPFGAEISFPLSGVTSYEEWGGFFAPADLDGDGDMDWVFRYGGQAPYKLVAYSDAGALLWTYDLNVVEPSGHGSPYICFDLDEDGKDEVYAFDRVFPQGDTIPECYLVKLNPLTGQEIKRVPFAGFRNDKVAQETIIGYLDGEHPYVITESGCYSDIHLIAYNGNLDEYWRFDVEAQDSMDDFWGANGHSMSCADVDNDGRDEVIMGSAALDDNGDRLWSLFPDASYLPVHEGDPNPLDMPVWPPEIVPNFFRHCDINFVGDIIPSHPGLEVWCGGEARYWGGVFDAATGEAVWARRFDSMQGPGFAGDIDSAISGMELYCKEHNHEATPDELWDCMGNQLDIATYGLDQVPDQTDASDNWSIWWKGTEHMQLLNVDGPTVGIPYNFNFVGDVMGDWREEYAYGANGAFHIFTADGNPVKERASLRTDRRYRTCLAKGFCATGFFERPLPGQPLFDPQFIGESAAARPYKNLDAMIVVRGNEIKALGRIAFSLCRIDGMRALARDLSAGQSILLDKEGLGAGIYYIRSEANGTRRMFRQIILYR